MTIAWQEPAQLLADCAPADWDGLWTVLFAAAHATSTLALSLPVVEGLDLTLTAMDLHQAREELDWARPGLRDTATTVSLGILPLHDDPQAARQVIDELVVAAMNRVADLAPNEDNQAHPDTATLVTVLGLLRSAHQCLTGR